MKVTVNYQSAVYLPVKACQEVSICLDPVWATRTTTGTPVVKATIENTGRFLDGNRGVRFENPRCSELYQYTLSVDLAQFIDETPGNPFEPSCSDIQEVVPYACVADIASA